MPDVNPELPPWVDAPADLAGLVEARIRSDSGEVAGGSRWSITSEGEAEWAMAQRARATALAVDVQAQFELWADRLAEWRRARLADLISTVRFFDGHLEQWAIEARAASGDKVKTVKLVSGEVSTTRASGPKVIVVDEDRFVGWALEAVLPGQDPADPTRVTFADAGCVKTTHSALVSVLRDLVTVVAEEVPVQTDAGPAANDDGSPMMQTVWRVLTADGEVVPGVDVELPTTTAKVKPHPLSLTQPNAPKEISS